MAFFSVSNDAITRQTNQSAFKRVMRIIPREKRYSTMPAVKIGRLGVDKNHHSNGVGTKVLDFIKGWFISGNKTGCRFIIVDALNKPDVLPFYQKNGFLFLSEKDKNESTRLMYFDLIAFKR